MQLLQKKEEKGMETMVLISKKTLVMPASINSVKSRDAIFLATATVYNSVPLAS